MTNMRQYIGFGDVENFLVKSYKRITGGHEFDIDKYGPYVDAVKYVLVPSLEKQILFFLERFVYNEDFQQSSYQPYFNRYKESMLTAYTKYNEIGTSIEAMRDSLTIDNLVDFLGQSLLTNSRLAKISDDLNAMGIEKNWLGYVNVLNYINEKDFWICSSSSSTTLRPYSSICSASNDNVLSDMNAEKGSHIVERTRGHKRPRKRAATHINRKHYKLKRLAQFSDRSFRVTKSLYDLLKSNWVLNDLLHTKRRLKRNCGGFKRTGFAHYRKNHRKTDWKNANLSLFIRKMNGPMIKTIDNEDQRNSEVRTCSSLPLTVEQLLSKFDRIDPSLTRFHCGFIRNKFRTKLYNVCSCLNNFLSRMDAKTINSIFLLCEIRTDCLKFTLKQTPPSKSNSSFFSARVMTCEALYRYGIGKNSPRQNLKSRNSWTAKKANELSTRGFVDSMKIWKNKNMDSGGNDEAISSIEICFTGCEGSAEDPQNVVKGLTCDPEELEGLTLRDSLSINDVMQKLELSPFNLQEIEQSFRIRSKIQDIVRSIMICTQEHSLPGRNGNQSISIQAIISTPSLHGIKHGVEVLPYESESSKALDVSKVVYYVKSKVFSSRSKETPDCKECVKLKKSTKAEECGKLTGSGNSDKSVIPKSCLETKGQSLRSGRSVRPNKSLKKSQASSSSRESAKLRNKNKYKICTTSEKPIRSKEFTGSHSRSLSKKIVESIASEISNALVRTKSNCNIIVDDELDYDIDVTLEIEESSQSSENITESISRHTHILPSMKSVKLGTSQKYFPHECEQSTSSLLSSNSEVLMCDNFTTMNKSMMSSSNRGTISTQSYDRIKHLIREKVSNKLSETDSCQTNSSKTIVSSGKYYISIPSSKTNRVCLRHEISESSSTSRDSLQPPVCNRRLQDPKTSSLDDENLFSKSSNCYSANSIQSSRAATFDKNSVYGCIEDRLTNRYFRDILKDYSDDAGDSPRYKDGKTQILYERVPRPDDCEFGNDERKKGVRRYHDSEISSEENETGFSQGFATDDDVCTNISWANDGIEYSYHRYPRQKMFTSYDVGRDIVQITPILDDYEKFDKIKRTSWSTCAIRSSISRDFLEVYPQKSYCRVNMRDRVDSQQKIFAFSPLNIIENYKKRFKHIDKSLRNKFQKYIDFCKNVKSNFRKQICLDDIYEISSTSIISSDLKRDKYNGINYFGG